MDLFSELKARGWQPTTGVFLPTGWYGNIIGVRKGNIYVGKSSSRMFYVIANGTKVLMDYITCYDIDTLLETLELEYYKFTGLTIKLI